MDKMFVTSDQIKLHYFVYGNGETPVVILPGMGETAETFTKVIEKLGKEYTFYTLDYRCHGESEDAEYGYHIERLAMDVKEMIQDAGIGRFHLIAHSMGNAVSWAFFELYGQQDVISYILEEEAPCLLSDPSWSEEESKTFRGNVEWPSFAEMDRNSVRNLFLSNLFHDHVNRDWRQEVMRIDLPVLIMMGTKSHYASPLLWDWMKQNIKGSKLVIMDGGHNLHYDCETEFVSEVIGFLKQ